MFKLSRAKYLQALESARSLEKTLTEENERLQESSRNLSQNWSGSQAEKSLGAINASLQEGAHAKALAYIHGMVTVMEEYLPGIEQMMAKREQIGRQLKQDEYVPPDLSHFQEDELIINYDAIEDIKADTEGALMYGDRAIQILENMIDEAEEIAGEYLNLTGVRESLEEGKKKLHRLENYRDEFVDFGKKMADLEYNMSYDLSKIMQELGDSDTLSNPLSNPMTSVLVSHEVRTEQMETDSPWYLERTESILEKDASGWTTEELELVGEALNESWNNKDHETAEKILNALRNAEENQIPILMCYENVQQNGELYYTMNRLNLYSAGFTQNTDGSKAAVTFHIEEMNGNTQITIRQTTEDGTDHQTERELAKITAMNPEKLVWKDGLKQKGYTDSEIENFLRSAVTDEDILFAARLSEGNYRDVYATDYEKLSGYMIYQLSIYQSILADRLGEEEFLAETEKQINILFDHTYADGTEKTYADGEYLILLSSGLKQQNDQYDRLKEEREFSDREKQTEACVENLSGLWSTFENYYTGKNSGEETITLLPSVNNNTCSLRIHNLRKDEFNRYCYEMGLVYNETGEEVPENIVTVDVEKVLATYQPADTGEEHIGHLFLDIGGMLPLIGMVCDGINAGWYALEGDCENALLSMVSFIPGAGDLFGAGKTGVKAVSKIGKCTGEALELAEIAGKYGDEAVEISSEVLEVMTRSTLKGGSEVVDEVIEGSISTLNDWVNRIPDLSKQAPIEIPSTATVKVQAKNGYDQISFKWTENGQNYEVRWHSKTPGAPEGQGNTWVVSRVTPGTPTGRVRTEHILVGNTWIPRHRWQDAINAYRKGTATQEQLQLLKDGHWQAP